jgi:hypothetical protein
MTVQTTDTVLMVRPAHFGFNQETAANNAFQINDPAMDAEQVQLRALQEFDLFVEALRNFGIRVIVAPDSEEPVKPDAVFPNNWVSFQPGGLLVTFPMFSPLRRLERREAVIEAVSDVFHVRRREHLEQWEAQDRFLEGTGSLILDHVHKLAYACISPRTDAGLMREYETISGYRPVIFHADDAEGQSIYHTNVMMALGETFVVICMESVRQAEERALLMNWFQQTGKEVIAISPDQMSAFAGNMLQLRNTKGETCLVMSEQAFKSLQGNQVAAIEAHTRILHTPLYTIERYGGGSARCMMAEVFCQEPE